MATQGAYKSKSESRATLTITSSTGTLLNGCLVPQHRYVSVSVTTPQGKPLCTVALSFDQFAHFLVSNSPTECTVTRYRDEDGKMATETVAKPESIQTTLKAKLGEAHTEQLSQFADIEARLYDIVNGNLSGCKKNIQALLHQVNCLKGQFEANVPFYTEMAQEQVAAVQNNLRAQLTVALGIPEERLKALEGFSSEPPQLTAGVRPVTVDYKPEPKTVKLYSEMTAMEVGDCLNRHLRRLEAIHTSRQKPEEGVLFGAGARGAGVKHVAITYVSYQHTDKVLLEDARKYVAYVAKVEHPDKLDRHYTWLKGGKAKT